MKKILLGATFMFTLISSLSHEVYGDVHRDSASL